jgi:hypothetical protein
MPPEFCRPPAHVLVLPHQFVQRHCHVYLLLTMINAAATSASAAYATTSPTTE